MFAYTYAVLHDPVYRHDYAVDLLWEFPRLPLYHDWAAWVKMGRELLELHIGFEGVEAYALERVETNMDGGDRVSPRVMLRANARDPTIAAKFNTYRFADYKEDVIELLRRVCTVSVATMDIVDDMAIWEEDGKLLVFGDRDKRELASVSMAQWAARDGRLQG